MRLTATLIAALLAVSPGYAQRPAGDSKTQQPASQENYEAEIIHVKTLTGDSFNRLLSMLSVFEAKIRGDENLRTIVVYAPKEVIAQMRRIVTELDTPGSEAAIGRNIEITMTLLKCSLKGGAGTKLPDDIEPVAKQLRAATPYKDIQVWDTLPLRLQEGKEMSYNGQLPTIPDHMAMLYLRIGPEAATRKDKGWSVRFRRFDFSLKIPVPNGTSAAGVPGFNYQDVGLSTSGDFLEGQKTVLGKVSGGESDTAIFVVISLKVLE